MRFLSLIRVQENTGLAPSEQLMADMGRLMGEMTAAGFSIVPGMHPIVPIMLGDAALAAKFADEKPYRLRRARSAAWAAR